VANRTGERRVEAILSLRQLRFTAAEIAETLSMALSTVSGILTRSGFGRLGRVGLEPAVRYERSRPGELVHIDVKKLGRIRSAGHRMTGERSSQARTRRNGRRMGVAGWEYVHIAIDDYSRLSAHRNRIPAPRAQSLSRRAQSLSDGVEGSLRCAPWNAAKWLSGPPRMCARR
jgi:hypothetical protein